MILLVGSVSGIAGTILTIGRLQPVPTEESLSPVKSAQVTKVRAKWRCRGDWGTGGSEFQTWPHKFQAGAIRCEAHGGASAALGGKLMSTARRHSRLGPLHLGWLHLGPSGDRSFLRRSLPVQRVFPII